MNTLFGNNVVNNHQENKSANNNFQQSSANANYPRESASNDAEQQSLFPNDTSPTAALDPIDFGNLPDFKSIEYKDGRIDSGDDDWIERKKCTMSEIAGEPIVIRSVHERKSKLISEKNMQYPFKTVIKACPKKDNPNMKYYKLS